ncbi:SDR family NAD(P)-dependent oxidoreductase OS=Streptomyces rutgersensis OX=53451 GN=F0345_01405 PE=4 SV=1 [Streptomyces diastaticus subsp. diastaticus]
MTVPALRRDRAEEPALLTALATLHVNGVHVDWAAWTEGTGARRVELPTYAFQRVRHWPDTRPPGAGGGSADPLDGAFWTALQGEDLTSLADLAVDTDALGAVLPAFHLAGAGGATRPWSTPTATTRRGSRCRCPPGAALAGTWLAVVPAALARTPGPPPSSTPSAPTSYASPWTPPSGRRSPRCEPCPRTAPPSPVWSPCWPSPTLSEAVASAEAACMLAVPSAALFQALLDAEVDDPCGA